MNVRNLTNEIKEYVLEGCGMDLVGACDSSLFDDEPDGHRPSDILPGAKSVIVFGRRLPDGGVQAAFRHFEDGHPTARGSYGAYCGDLAPNCNLFFATFDLSQFIEKKYDFIAAPMPCGTMQCGLPSSVPIPAFIEPFKVGLPFNIERAAFAAGLGDYGWSGRILTEQYGPRVQFGAVITTMPLEYDEPYSGEKLCRGETCRACARHCPTGALPEADDFARHCPTGALPEADDPDTLSKQGEKRAQSVQRGAGGTVRETAAVRLNSCIVAACALRREFGGEDDYVDSLNPTDDELIEAFKRKPINNYEGLDHYPKWRCDKCLIYCPTGGWHEKFAKRGLTKEGEAGAGRKL
jgi:epoxyqueuosine reductase QueG